MEEGLVIERGWKEVGGGSGRLNYGLLGIFSHCVCVCVCLHIPILFILLTCNNEDMLAAGVIKKRSDVTCYF